MPRHASRRPLLLLIAAPLALVLASVGCSTARTPPATAAAENPDARLPIASVMQRLEDGKLLLDISVTNPHGETVHGVRVLYRILVNTDPDSKEIARTQREFALELAPGDEQTVTLALPPQAGERGAFGTFLHVFAGRLGERVMPLPAQWQSEAP